MTQNQLIRAHLEDGGEITAILALNLYGVFRLAARVHQLRNEGMIIHSEMITKGKKKFAKYFVEKV